MACATLGSPWAAKRVRKVSRGWQTTVAEHAAKPPHTKWIPAVWLSYTVVLWTTSVRISKLANCRAHKQNYVKSCMCLFYWESVLLSLRFYRPVQPRSKWTGAVLGCGPSRKRRVPPLNECSGRPEIIPSTCPPASVKTQAQSAAVGERSAALTAFSISTTLFPVIVQLLKMVKYVSQTETKILFF